MLLSVLQTDKYTSFFCPGGYGTPKLLSLHGVFVFGRLSAIWILYSDIIRVQVYLYCRRCYCVFNPELFNFYFSGLQETGNISEGNL